MKSLVISVDLGDLDYAAHAEEFLMLASGAGADIVEVLTARRSRPDAAGFIGSGKIEEAAALVKATGAEAPSDWNEVASPETYIGYSRAENFISPGGAVNDEAHAYSVGTPDLNQWGLSGNWTVGKEQAALNESGGGIVYRFHARDLHLVLGPAADGKPVRFRVTIDGKVPGNDHGMDTDAEGQGSVTSQRLYQLIRQSGAIADRTFEIRFLDPGVSAYAFTFG